MIMGNRIAVVLMWVLIAWVELVIYHIYLVLSLLVSEPHYITMNFISIRVCTHLSNLPSSNPKRLVKTNRNQKNMNMNLKSQWMVKSCMIEIILVQYCVWIWTQSTTIQNIDFWMSLYGYWVHDQWTHRMLLEWLEVRVHVVASQE